MLEGQGRLLEGGRSQIFGPERTREEGPAIALVAQATVFPPVEVGRMVRHWIYEEPQDFLMHLDVEYGRKSIVKERLSSCLEHLKK